MAKILDASISFYLSGGSTNISPRESYGGDKSSSALTDSIKLFKDIQPIEKAIGKTDYRIIYVGIDEGDAGTGSSGKLWLTTNDLAAVTYELAIGAINTIISKPASEIIAPTGLTFAAAPSTEISGLVIPNVTGGDFFAIGIKRIVAITTDTKFNSGPELFVNWASA